MNKKGFTLVELIGVIALLGVIALISTPIISGTIKRTKEKAYKEQKNTIINSAKRYVTEVSSKTDDVFYITIEDLIEEQLLEDDNILDPRDETDLRDPSLDVKVKVTYVDETKTYNYEYCRVGENDC